MPACGVSMRTYYLCAGFSLIIFPQLSLLCSLCLIKHITLLLTCRLQTWVMVSPPSPSSLHQFTLHPFQLGLNSIYQVISLWLLLLPSQSSCRAHYFPDRLLADVSGSSFSYSNLWSKVARFSSTNADNKHTPQAGIQSAPRCHHFQLLPSYMCLWEVPITHLPTSHQSYPPQANICALTQTI